MQMCSPSVSCIPEIKQYFIQVSFLENQAYICNILYPGLTSGDHKKLVDCKNEKMLLKVRPLGRCSGEVLTDLFFQQLVLFDVDNA